uniref:Uncharacterized protein n=1 Tax=Rhizophora mucronata TaxID=61149 RepID=A0A2P2QW41_RHIMU
MHHMKNSEMLHKIDKLKGQ